MEKDGPRIGGQVMIRLMIHLIQNEQWIITGTK